MATVICIETQYLIALIKIRRQSVANVNIWKKRNNLNDCMTKATRKNEIFKLQQLNRTFTNNQIKKCIQNKKRKNYKNYTTE